MFSLHLENSEKPILKNHVQIQKTERMDKTLHLKRKFHFFSQLIFFLKLEYYSVQKQPNQWLSKFFSCWHEIKSLSHATQDTTINSFRGPVYTQEDERTDKREASALQFYIRFTSFLTSHNQCSQDQRIQRAETNTQKAIFV